MDKQVRTRGSAGPPLPLASLRLLASPLQLAYAHIWQVIQRRSVGRYSKVEEFVVMVTRTVPELMSAKQTAQLVLGLRARVILELVKEATPDFPAIQALVNKLKIPAGTDVDVERSQTNFMVLVQILLKTPAERQRFFQEVFPVHYGAKYDTALQALIAGLVYKLEQLLPVPNLSQLGTMLPSQPSVLEEYGHFMPDHGELTVLMRHQRQKGLLTTSAISTTVGDCVLSSLSFLPDPLEPAGPQEPPAQALDPATSRPGDPGPEEEAGGEETPDQPDDADTRGGTDACQIPAKLTPDIGSGVPEILSSAVVHTTPPAPQEPCTTQEEGEELAVGGVTCDALPSEPPPPPTHHMDVEEAVALLETGTALAELERATGNRQPRPAERLIPFRVVHVPVRSSAPAAASLPEGGAGQQRPQIQRVTLHQWVSQMASNSLSLPTLPPLSPPREGDGASDDGAVHGDSPGFRRRRRPAARPAAERFVCDTCGKRFAYASRLADHRRLHTGEKPFACGACGKAFRTRAFLNTHLPVHGALRPHACASCGRRFHRAAALRKHALTHGERKPFHCTACDKGFAQAAYFRRHMECHTSRSSFPCGECPKAFPTEFKRANHRRWHARERPHMCERCGKRFAVPSLLKRHMGYHAGARQYLCSQCGKTFVYMSDLNRHLKDHRPRATLPCAVCHKTFSSKYCLRIHTRIHTREKPYVCPVCGKAFTQAGNMRVHVRLHGDARPHACERCGKTYKLASHLNAHRRTHLFAAADGGDARPASPWPCGVCGESFSTPGALRRHERAHLREEADAVAAAAADNAAADAAGYSGKRPQRSKTLSHKRSYANEEEEDDNDDEEEEEGGRDGGDVYG